MDKFKLFIGPTAVALLEKAKKLHQENPIALFGIAVGLLLIAAFIVQAFSSAVIWIVVILGAVFGFGWFYNAWKEYWDGFGDDDWWDGPAAA